MIIKIAIDSLCVILELFSLNLFLQCALGKVKRMSGAMNWVYGLLFVFNLCLPQYIRSTWLMVVLVMGSYLVLAWQYEGKSLVRVFCGAIFFLFAFLLESVAVFLISAMANRSISEAISSIPIYFAMVVLSKFSLLICTKVYSWYKQRIRYNLNARSFVSLCSFPLASIIVICQIGYTVPESQLIRAVLIYALLVVANLSVFYLFERQMKVEYEEVRMSNLETQLAEQKLHYDELYREARATHKLWHNMKNMLLGLKPMIKEGRIDQSLAYIDDWIGELSAQRMEIDTGNPEIDSVLATKMRGAPDCEFTYKIAPLGNVDIDGMDLAMLIASMVDNAVDACKKLPEGQRRWVNVRMSVQGESVSISVRNPFDGVLRQDRGKLLTTKPEHKKHGYGLETVRTIANKYRGEMTYEAKDNQFGMYALLFSRSYKL